MLISTNNTDIHCFFLFLQILRAHKEQVIDRISSPKYAFTVESVTEKKTEMTPSDWAIRSGDKQLQSLKNQHWATVSLFLFLRARCGEDPSPVAKENTWENKRVVSTVILRVFVPTFFAYPSRLLRILTVVSAFSTVDALTIFFFNLSMSVTVRYLLYYRLSFWPSK